MAINHSKCGNCYHPSSKHGGNGVCGVRGCGCRNFKPAGS